MRPRDAGCSSTGTTLRETCEGAAQGRRARRSRLKESAYSDSGGSSDMQVGVSKRSEFASGRGAHVEIDVETVS
jgi:hypothetical protein